MSINAVPLLPHTLSLEIPTCSGSIFLSIFYYDPITITVGGTLLHAIPKTWAKCFLILILLEFLETRNEVVIYQPD